MGSRKHISIFLQGIAVVVPIGITIYVCAYAMWWLDKMGRRFLKQVVDFDAPGIGVVVGLAAIYLIGLFTRSLLFRKVGRLGEAVVERIPLVKSLYGALRDMMKFVGGGQPSERGVPARLTLSDGEVHMLGIVTQKQPQDHMGEGEAGRVAVYLPMSLQVGGFTVFVPPENIEYLEDMSVETAMKLSMTAGVGRKRKPLRRGQKPDDRDGSDESAPGAAEAPGPAPSGDGA